MASRIVVNLDTSIEFFLNSKCKQNDDLILECSIFENGLAKDLSNCSIVIQALKADKTYIIQNTDITKSNNKFTANLVRDFTRVPGKTEIEIVLTESSKQNTTFSFCLEVVGSVIRGAVESPNTVTILENLQEKIVEAGAVKEETEQLIKSGGAATTGDIQKVNAHLEHINTQFISTKSFDTLADTIAKAKEFGLKKIYVDRDFEEEINLPSGFALFSQGKKIKKIKAYGTRNNIIDIISVGSNYIESPSLVEGDLIIIDKPSTYREINKVLYVENGKAYLQSDILFDYSEGSRVIKINPIKNILLENLIVDNLDLGYCENVVLNKMIFNKTSRILMTYGLTIDNIKVNSIKDIESRLDIFACVRCININNLEALGGNTESDNSNIKLNQVADVNINNLVLKSAYKPINKYGYNGYFHNFMID